MVRLDAAPSCVRGNQVVGRKFYDIARKDLSPRKLHSSSTAQHAGARSDLASKFLDRALRAKGLKEVQTKLKTTIPAMRVTSTRLPSGAESALGT